MLTSCVAVLDAKERLSGANAFLNHGGLGWVQGWGTLKFIYADLVILLLEI